MTLEWVVTNKAALLNSVGLAFDIVGAFFVGYEVVQQFRGRKLDARGGWVAGAEVVDNSVAETTEYQRWERRKYRNMKWGLSLLTIGFLVQIVSNWIK